jgi:glycosyltransferase involved in cell wall biosynthesis
MSQVNSQLRILQVAPAVEGGGGEQIALRLQDALRARGQRPILAVGRGALIPQQDMVGIPNRWEVSARARWIRRRLNAALVLTRGRGERYLFPLAEAMAFPRVTWDLWRGNEDFTQLGSDRLLELAPELPDIVLLHNLHARWDRREGFFDLTSLETLSRRVPVILLPQDPWLLTGHCAHPITCPRWSVGCGRCPDLKIYPAIRRDATAWNWQRKRKIYARSTLHLAAPSGWLKDMFNEAEMPLASSRVIANGVDTNSFSPGERASAREALGLNPQRKLVMISGNFLRTNPWKGFGWVLETAERIGAHLAIPPTDFLCVGESDEPIDFGRVRVLFAGRGIPPSRMPAYYRAADIYFHPSRADTAPFSVLEAMSCALPVVATAVCGIPEQIENEVTGFLTAPGDTQAMASAISRLLLEPDTAASMGRHGRMRVVEKFDFANQADSLLNYLQAIVAGNG